MRACVRATAPLASMRQRHRDLPTDPSSYWEIPPPPSSTGDRAFKTWTSSGNAQHPNHRPSLRSNGFSLTVHLFPNWWVRYGGHLYLLQRKTTFTSTQTVLTVSQSTPVSRELFTRTSVGHCSYLKCVPFKVSKMAHQVKMLASKSDSPSSIKGSHDGRKSWLLCLLTSWGPRHSYPHK